MAKYRDLIELLAVPAQPEARSQLVAADGRALGPLTRALISHPNCDVREEIAEILGERKHWKAIPALIEALGDEALFVRQDALWSIEAICRLQPVALSDWLDLHAELADAKDRVLVWWSKNRVFIENNPNLG